MILFVVPGGVAPVVDIVNVVGTVVVVVAETGLGENEAAAPDGRGVVTVRVALHAELLPLKVTFTMY